jgi:hypothetical protein
VKSVVLTVSRNQASTQLETRLEDSEWDKLRKAIQKRKAGDDSYVIKPAATGAEIVLDLMDVVTATADTLREGPGLVLPG